MEIVKLKNKKGYMVPRQGSNCLMDNLADFFFNSLFGRIDYVKGVLSSQDGVFNSNSIYLSREGDFVTIEINVLDPENDDSEQESIPYEKFINLLDKWKEIDSLTEAPNEIIVLMDDDYNFDVCYEYGNDLTKVKID